jgi:hypothetical protein
MRGLGKFLRLPAAERMLFLEAVLALAVIRLGLWVLPLQRLRDVIDHAVSRGPRAFVADGSLPHLAARAVTRASVYVPKVTCLTQALTMQALLQRRGCAAELCIGLARGGRHRVEGHAWVEVGGSAVFGEGFASEMVLPGFQGGR